MKLRQLFESPTTAVIAFGRMNPPTIGHQKLVQAIKSHNGDHYVFLSQSQKPKTDPLAFTDKLRYAKFFFPEVTIGHPQVKTIIQALQKINELGYEDLIYVAGSDRVQAFEELINKYNGKDYNFKNIQVVSAGERDPDAEGAEGMSASKMRQAAADGNLEAFTEGTPRPELAEEMFAAVRQGMGIRDEEPEIAESSIASKINWGGQHDDEDDGKDKKEKKQSLLDKLKAAMGVSEDVSPEDEDKFHNELDDLVHKYFGDSPDEEKMLKKYKKTDEEAPPGREDQVKALKKEFPDDEGAPYAIAWAQHNKKKKKTNESDVVIDKARLRDYLRMLIDDAIDKEEDINKLSKVLKMLVGKEIRTRGDHKFTITSEDVVEACKNRRMNKRGRT